MVEVFMFVKNYWFIFQGVLIPIATYLIGKYKFVSKERNLLVNGLCSLERQILYDSIRKYIPLGYCPLYAKESISELYLSYHSLGGDSFITSMYDQLIHLPIRDDDNDV